MPTTADSAPQLMKLGDAEAVRVLDHHHGHVRHVDADLYDRRGDEHLELAAPECGHRGFLLLRGKLPVEQADGEPG